MRDGPGAGRLEGEMYKLLALGAAGFLVLAGQANAQPLVASGDIAVSGQFTSWTGDGYYTPESGVGVDAYGRFMVPFGSGFSVQFDAAFETTPTISTLGQSVLVGGHLSWRDPTRFMVGLIGGAGIGTVDPDSPVTDYEDYQSFLLGVEGQIYMGDTTFFKQAGVAWAYEGEPDEEPLDLVFVRGGVRHFTPSGWVLDGEGGFAWGTFDGGASGLTDVSVLNWGFGVEKALQTQLPISIFARYEGALYTLDYCDASMTEHRIMGGFRIALGGLDAKSQDRLGANSDLPRFPAFSALDGLEYCDIN